MKCKQCAKCCTEKTVAITTEEVQIISEQCKSNFYRVRNTGVKILNWKQHGNQKICMFLSPYSNQCLIYNIRPGVCKNFNCKGG